MDDYLNFAISEVAIAPSPASSGTTLYVKAGHGVRFPVPPFNASIWPKNTLPDPANGEIVRVTALATDTMTILRAQEFSAARAILIGDLIAATITKRMIADLAGASGLRSEVGLVVVGASSLNGTVATGSNVSVGGELSVPAGSISMAGLLYEAGRGIAMGVPYAFNPVITGLDVNNGSASGQITRAGTLVFFTIMIVWGSASSFLQPYLRVTMPIPWIAAAQPQLNCDGILFDATNSQFYSVTNIIVDGTTMEIRDRGKNVGESYMMPINNANPDPSGLAPGTRLFLKGWYQENGY